MFKFMSHESEKHVFENKYQGHWRYLLPNYKLEIAGRLPYEKLSVLQIAFVKCVKDLQGMSNSNPKFLSPPREVHFPISRGRGDDQLKSIG